MQHQTLKLIGSSIAALGVGAWAVACASTEAQPNYTPDGTTSGTATAAAVGGTPTGTTGTTGGAVTGNVVTSNTVTGGAVGTTGAVAGTAAATVTGVGGATATAATVTSDTTTSTTGEVDYCATAPTLTAPLVTDFESYDGSVEAGSFGWTLFDDGASVQRYAGLYGNSDGTGTATFSMVAGNGSVWAASAANPAATGWGGGVGFWIQCVNASSFTGISLAVRGSTPTGEGVVSLTLGGVGYSVAIPITETFVVQQLPFSSFTSDAGLAATSGALLEGITVSAGMVYVDDGTGTYVPEPGAYEVVVDDVTFY